MNTSRPAALAALSLALAFAAALPATALSPVPPPTQDRPLRIAMISDGGSFSDNSYNQNCREGLEEILYSGAPVYVQFYEPLPGEQFSRQLGAFAERNYRIVVAVGGNMAPHLERTARLYTNTFFVGVDAPFDPAPNVRTLTFQVDECAFSAGYLAAAWADLQDPDDPAVAWVGGQSVDSVNQFTVAFVNGVKHYNETKGRNVRVLGRHIGSFNRPDAGKAYARRVIAENGVDVVFAAGGYTGCGALAAAKEASKWAIGVDTDQYYTLPDVAPVLLTSCLKRMDRAVKTVIEGALDGQYWGGTRYVGNLANHGIGLAPFHDLDDQIPATLRRELDDLQRQILSGAIATGWTPGAVPPEVP